MDIQAEKLQLIAWLAKVNDRSLINKLKAFRSKAESDWWDKLTDEQKEDIESGLVDLEAGRKKEFKKVLSKYN